IMASAGCCSLMRFHARRPSCATIVSTCNVCSVFDKTVVVMRSSSAIRARISSTHSYHPNHAVGTLYLAISADRRWWRSAAIRFETWLDRQPVERSKLFVAPSRAISWVILVNEPPHRMQDEESAEEIPPKPVARDRSSLGLSAQGPEASLLGTLE